MITFRAIVIPSNRRRDGTFPVVIRVTFGGKSRRLATTLVCKSSDLTRSHKIKNPSILSKSEMLISEMRESVRDLSPFALCGSDVDAVVKHIRARMSGRSFSLDFFDWADKFVMTKRAGTRAVYTNSLNRFASFLGRREMDINTLTRAQLEDFAAWADRQPGCRTGAGVRHLIRLGIIYSAARHRYNDEDTGVILIPRNPFSKTSKTLPPARGQKSLGVSVMQRIITSSNRGCPKRCIREALDIFVVSFALMGANMADLYAAGKPSGGVWIYNRQKTKDRRHDAAEMRVDIPSVIAPQLERLRGKCSWLLIGERSTSNSVSSTTNRALRMWAREQGLPPFTFYAARHTWASLARNCGIDKSTIDDCLAHVGDYRVADIYAEKSWSVINAANAKVLALFDWS